MHTTSEYTKLLGCLVLAIVLLAICSNPAYADTVILKNGGKLKGKILSQTEEEVVIEISDAGRVTIKMKVVADIVIEPEDKSVEVLPPSKVDKKAKPSLKDKDRTGEPEGAEEEASVLEILIRAVLAVLFSGFLLWGAINLTDPGNRKNKFLAAVGWSIIITGASLCWPLYGLIFSLMVLMMILFSYYDLSFFRTIFVIVLLFGLHIVIGILLVALFLFIKSLFWGIPG